MLVMKRTLYDILWRFSNKHSGKLILLLLDISYISDRLNEMTSLTDVLSMEVCI